MSTGDVLEFGANEQKEAVALFSKLVLAWKAIVFGNPYSSWSNIKKSKTPPAPGSSFELSWLW